MSEQRTMARTFTVWPDEPVNEKEHGVVTITCNSIDDAAHTAKIFFFTPCKIRDPHTEDLFFVRENGSISCNNA